MMMRFPIWGGLYPTGGGNGGTVIAGVAWVCGASGLASAFNRNLWHVANRPERGVAVAGATVVATRGRAGWISTVSIQRVGK